MSKAKEEYNPINCDHKKPNGFSAYDMQSAYTMTGENLMKEVHISVCLKCGEIKIWGKELVEGKIQYFEEVFSINHPNAIYAIVKNSDYMNSQTEGYIPLLPKKL